MIDANEKGPERHTIAEEGVVGAQHQDRKSSDVESQPVDASASELKGNEDHVQQSTPVLLTKQDSQPATSEASGTENERSEPVQTGAAAGEND